MIFNYYAITTVTFSLVGVLDAMEGIQSQPLILNVFNTKRKTNVLLIQDDTVFHVSELNQGTGTWSKKCEEN